MKVITERFWKQLIVIASMTKNLVNKTMKVITERFQKQLIVIAFIVITEIFYYDL